MATLVVCFLVSPLLVPAQEKNNIKFGKIDVSAFTLPDDPYLNGADAVYLADIGSSEFIGNSKSWFTLVFKRHVRIKINNNNGFEAADFEIPLSFDGSDAEKMFNLKGITYNLENGKVEETVLKSDQVFVDKKNKNLWVKKFTLPGVKVGSIIDVQYTVESDFMWNLQPWNFQGKFPRMWSEYEVNIPEFFNYLFFAQGSSKFHVNKKSEAFKSYTVLVGSGASRSSIEKIDSKVLTTRWVMKDMPALKAEPFTSTLNNHITKINFQLNRIQFPYETTGKNYMNSWPKMVEELNKSEFFGLNIYKNNNWLDDDLKSICGSLADTLAKAKKIHAYLRDNYTCIDNTAKYMTDNGLHGTVKAKKGNAAEINLLMIAMLQHEHITAYPVILSTKEHGYTSEVYPLMDRFNLTVAVALIGGEEYYLDASDPMLGFAKLNSNCYNGHAMVIVNEGIPVYLEADNLKEKKLTTFIAFNDDNGKWEGTINSTLGYYESLHLREMLKEKGKEDVVKTMQSAIAELTIEKPEFENVEDKDGAVVVKYALDLKNSGEEDIVYMNPMMGEGYKENPFKSAERSYPVEMPYAQDETYVATIDIPKGYVVDELPKSARVKLNDEDGMFEYLISRQDDRLMLRSRLLINRANFTPDDYQTLRDFFGYVVKKHSEQIVFKKKAG